MESAADGSEGLISLVSDMEITRRDSGCLYGSVTLDQCLLLELPKLLESGLIDGLVRIDSVDRDIETISADDIGKEINIGVVESLARSHIKFYESIDDLISVPSNMLDHPERFYLIDSGFFYPCDDVPDKVRHYFDLVKLLTLLRGGSDYQEGFGGIIGKLVFLQKKSTRSSLEVYF